MVLGVPNRALGAGAISIETVLPPITALSASRLPGHAGPRLRDTVDVVSDEHGEGPGRFQRNDPAKLQIPNDRLPATGAVRSEVANETMANILDGISTFQRPIIQILRSADERSEGSIVLRMGPCVVCAEAQILAHLVGDRSGKTVVFCVIRTIEVVHQAGVVVKNSAECGFPESTLDRLSFLYSSLNPVATVRLRGRLVRLLRERSIGARVAHITYCWPHHPLAPCRTRMVCKWKPVQYIFRTRVILLRYQSKIPVASALRRPKHGMGCCPGV
jgi:hypothetical protein